MFFVAVLRLVVLFVVLGALYLLMLRWTRTSRRRALEDEWVVANPDQIDRETFVARGMAEWERSWDRKLLYGIFVLPIAVAISLSVLAH